MELEPVQVSARWETSGRFLPVGMIWQGKTYTFHSTGRFWEDQDGWHILCMLAGGQVYELVFRLGPASWHLRQPASSPQVM